MKRSKLRPISTKKAAMNRKWGPVRLAFRREMTCCICGTPNPDSVHEIVGGSFRDAAFVDRRYWLAVCVFRCHGVVQYMNKFEQLALKKQHDPAFYDPTILEVKKRN